MDNALSIGTAAEHLVCADLLLQGFRAFMSDAGCPFDVVVDMNDRLLRVQVKATLATRNVNASGRVPRIAYSWSVRRRGRDGSSHERLDIRHCDIVALVAIDLRVVAYFPVGALGETAQLSPPGETPKTVGGKRSWARDVAGYPFEAAVRNDPADFARAELTHCPQGHEYTEENKMPQPGAKPGAKPHFSCRECSRIRTREFMRARAAR